MQNVRIIYNNGKEDLFYDTKVSVNFKDQKMYIWNGRYWEETPFKEIFVVATWDENEE